MYGRDPLRFPVGKCRIIIIPRFSRFDNGERGDRALKFSPAERAAAALCAAALLFFAGWFARGRSTLGHYTVSAAHAAQSPGPTPSATFYVPDPDTLVDLNAAGLEDLTGLPGIGETRARAILDYRDAHGPFRYPEELTQVPGIGEATLRDLIPYITVTPPEKEAEP